MTHPFQAVATAVRNGDDDVVCPLCGGACDERTW